MVVVGGEERLSVPGCFAPNPFPPLDVSPVGRFAPGHFAPIEHFSPGCSTPPYFNRAGGGGAVGH